MSDLSRYEIPQSPQVTEITISRTCPISPIHPICPVCTLCRICTLCPRMSDSVTMSDLPGFPPLTGPMPCRRPVYVVCTQAPRVPRYPPLYPVCTGAPGVCPNVRLPFRAVRNDLGPTSLGHHCPDGGARPEGPPYRRPWGPGGPGVPGVPGSSGAAPRGGLWGPARGPDGQSGPPSRMREGGPPWWVPPGVYVRFLAPATPGAARPGAFPLVRGPFSGSLRRSEAPGAGNEKVTTLPPV